MDGWRAWVKEHSLNGGAALYAVSKPPIPWHASSFVCSEGQAAKKQPATLHQEMELLEVEWGHWWRVGALEDSISWPRDLGPLFPRPPLQELRECIRSFPAKSGCGFDQITPRQLLSLSEAGLVLLIDLIEDIEAECCWPQIWTKVVFLTKREGGLRPIALIHILARLQGRLRSPMIAVWQQANPRPYWWSAKGRSSDKLVWVQTAGAEWASERQLASGLILLDLQKAFEH
eukprot:437833-Pyramimonas_sp.AAC.1